MYIKELIIESIFSFVSGLPIVSNVVANPPPPPLLSAYAATFFIPLGWPHKRGTNVLVST